MLKANKKQFLPAIIFAAVYLVLSLVSTVTNITHYDEYGYDNTIYTIISWIFYSVLPAAAVIIFSLKAKEDSNKSLTKLFVFLLAISLISSVWQVISPALYNGIIMFIVQIVLFRVTLVISSVKSNKILDAVIVVAYLISWAVVILARLEQISYYSTEDKITTFISLIQTIAFDLMLLYPWYVVIVKKHFSSAPGLRVINVKKTITLTEDDLESLKAKYDAGLITDDEYQQKKAEIMSKL